MAGNSPILPKGRAFFPFLANSAGAWVPNRGSFSRPLLCCASPGMWSRAPRFILPHLRVSGGRLHCTYCTTVLYCTVLYCTVLHSTVQYCTVVYVLYCTVPQVLYSTVRTVQYRSVLRTPYSAHYRTVQPSQYSTVRSSPRKPQSATCSTIARDAFPRARNRRKLSLIFP